MEKVAVLITGHMRAGKSSFAGALRENYGFSVYPIAGKLKELYNMQVGLLEKDRKWLQETGNTMRQVFGNDFWVEQTWKQVQKDKVDLLVVDDVRYENELEYLCFRALEDGYTVICVFVDVSLENIVSRGGEIHLLSHESEQFANKLHNSVGTVPGSFGFKYAQHKGIALFHVDGNQALVPFVEDAINKSQVKKYVTRKGYEEFDARS